MIPQDASPAWRNPALDLLRAAAGISLFHLVFFSGYVETGFGLSQAAASGKAAALFARAAMRGALTLMSLGLCALDLFFVISGFCCYQAALSGKKSPITLALRRYARFAPLYAAVAVPVFAYAGIPPRDMLFHLAALDGGLFGSFVFSVFGHANYPYLFGLFCAVLFAPGISRAARRPLTLAVLFAGLALWIGSGRAPGFLNFHACAFFLGALAAALDASPWAARFPAPKSRARAALACLSGAALCLWSWTLWTHRGAAFLPLLTGTDGRTFVLALVSQSVSALLVLSLARVPGGTGEAMGASGRLSASVRKFGAAGLSFFTAFALYGLIIGDLDLPGLSPFWTMAARYAASLTASLVLCRFFHRYFERFPAPAGVRRENRKA